MNIKFPKTDEQEKIGAFFEKLDRLIKNQESYLDLNKKLKKSLLQKLFPKEGEDRPELRFSGFNDKWKNTYVSCICDIKSGVGFPVREQGGTSGTPFFKVSDMTKNNSVMNKSSNYVTNNQIAKNKWKVIKSDFSIIFAKVGEALNKNRKRVIFGDFLIDNNMMTLNLDLDLVYGYFVKSLFETIYLPKYAQVGALPSFNASDISSIKIKLPSLEEQEKIGSLFKSLDEKIEAEEKKLKAYKDFKKSMLQKMFV